MHDGILSCLSWALTLCSSPSVSGAIQPSQSKPLQGILLNIFGRALKPNNSSERLRTTRERETTVSFVRTNVWELIQESVSRFISHSPFFFSLPLSLSVARLGASQTRRRFYGDGATKLPGQRPRGICDGSEEVHRVLHLCAVFHDTRWWPPQPAQSFKDTWGQ